MPALSTKTKHYHRERIRDILVQQPQTSIEGIKQRLETDGLSLDRHYVGKLVNEIYTERTKRADTWISTTTINGLKLPSLPLKATATTSPYLRKRVLTLRLMWRAACIRERRAQDIHKFKSDTI